MFKKMLFLMSSVLSILYLTGLAGQSIAAIDPKSIVAVWLCDEGKGDTVKDSSGHKYDGKFVKEVGWADGKFGKGLEFLGKVGSRVEIPHNDSLSLAEWTVTAWAKAKLPPGGDWAVILVKDPANGVQNYALDYNEQGRVFSEITSGAGNWSDCGSKTIAYDDKWHFLAASYNGKALLVYIDSKKEGEQVFGKPDVNKAPVTIGGRMDNTQPLLGVVDDIGLFSTALSENDLKAIMEQGLGSAIGIAAVEPASKLTTTWGQIKQR